MTVPQVVYGDQTRRSRRRRELMSLMLASGKVEACLARNFFRYTYGRWEDPTTDGCALEDARKALASGGTDRRSRGRRGEDARSSGGGRSSEEAQSWRDEIIDISRRQMLRGIGGATLALPVLPSLLCKTGLRRRPGVHARRRACGG